MNYYNEIDPFAVEWLRQLIKAGHIAEGEVDTRSIEDVHPGDLHGYTQCHFFAGIGGWSYALRQAGWPDDRPVWTGSCPCQPFSAAGKRGGTADERHLWPAFFHLIQESAPRVLFGEQVASKGGLSWFDTVQADLESAAYACWAWDLSACAFGAPHVRQRLYWVADTAEHGRERYIGSPEVQVQENGSPKTLDAWHGTGSAFENWQKLLAKPNVCRMDDGIPSTLDIRPRLRAYGNAIVPQVAQAFIEAYMDVTK